MITLHHETETDFTKNGYGRLDDNIVNPEVYWEMNSEFKFSFEYPLFGSNEEIISHLTNGNLVRVPVPYMDDQFFRMYRTKEVLGYVRVEARHLFYDLIDNLIEDTNIVGKNGLGALTQLLNATQYAHKFKAFSDIDSTANMRIVRYNPVKALLDDSEDNTYVNRWDGELYRDNYNIHMRKRLGTNRGIKIEHKKDLLGYEATIDESTIATRIMPKGFDGLLLPEKYVDSPLLDPDNPKIRVVEYSDVMAAIGDYEDYEDAIPLSEAYEELRRLAREEFSVHHVDEPETVIHVDFITLENTKEYEEFSELQEIHQGDTVQVSVPEQGFEITSRLVAFTSDPLRKNHYTSTTLGNHVLEYTSSRTEIDVIRKEIKNTNELALMARQSANGKNSNFWGTVDPNTLELNAQIDDTYFQENGDYFAIWEYVDVHGEKYWRKGPNTDFGKEIANQLKNAIEDIEIAQETADEAVDEINTAVSNAGFTSLSDSLTGIQSIANSAQNNSITAVANAQTALNLASSVQSDVASIDLRVDEIEGTLSLKADSQSLDTLTGRVNLAETNIGINAQGLALKANQSTVDTLAGTVSSLGTEFDVVAGQVSSRVWNTDIETAIDGIEVGGRNLVIRSTEEKGTLINISGQVVNASNHSTSDYIPVTPNTDYMFTKSYSNLANDAGFFRWTWYDEEKNYIRRQAISNNEFLWRTPNNVHYVRVSYPDDSYPKLEKGNIATDWTPAPEDTDAKIDHIETEWTQTFDAFSQTVAGIDGRVTSQKQTIDTISSTVSGHGNRISTVEQTADGLQTTVASKASQTQVTQLSTLLNSTVTTVDGHETQISQLHDNINLRVSKGELLSQINLEAGRTLIQSDRLLIDANNTVITGTAWMDGAVIANASIDGAKIQDATIGSAKIASLDASKISTGTLDGIQITGVTITGSTFIQDSALTGSTNGRWDRTGITMSDPQGLLIMNMNRQGLNFHGSGVSHQGTYINNDLINVQNATIYNLNVTGPTARMNAASFSGNLTVGSVPNDIDAGIIFNGQSPPVPYDRMIWAGYGSSGNGLYTYFNGWRRLQNEITNTSDIAMNTLTVNTLTISNALTLTNRLSLRNSGLQFSGGTIPSPAERQMWIGYGYADNGIYVSMGGSWHKHGATISDERLKKNIVETSTDSLTAIKSWEFVEFEWRDSGYGSGQQFGLIAQNTSHIVNYYDEVDRWEIDTQKQTMMNSHAIQQLALREQNTNQVASQALQATETNAQKIKRLEERVEYLEGAA